MKAKGFSLIGLIAALSVLALLLAFVLLELDPAGKINQAKDSKRQQDVLLISYAFEDYIKDNQGALPDSLVPTTDKSVLCTEAGTLTCDDSVDIDCLVLDKEGTFLSKYLEDLPVDPDKTTDTDTGYYLQLDANNKIVIGACEVSETNDSSIIYASTISYDVPAGWDCAAAGGYEYDGHCWFSGGNYKNCTTVCSDFSLTCEPSVSTASWNSCAVHLGIDPTACNYGGSPRCFGYNSNYSYMPSYYQAPFYRQYCYYDYNAASIIDCNGATNVRHYICACQE